MSIEPLDEIMIEPWVAGLPKADLHLHQEERPRQDRIVARGEGRPAYDWRAWSRHLLDDVAPGMDRFYAMFAPDTALPIDGPSVNDVEMMIGKIVDVLAEGGADGAIYIEIRFGTGGLALLRPDFMELFREAERRVQAEYPRLRAEPLGFLSMYYDPARLAEAEGVFGICLRLAKEGLAGIDFSVSPYNAEVNPALWPVIYQWAARAADAGLGITMHAGEFSTANVAGALGVPGLRRLGHAVYVASDPVLLEEMARRGITAECCLSCNVILGGVSSYEEHPIRKLADAGVPVTLNTDNPVRICTTIGREYALAVALGFSPEELLGCTRNAILASFTSAERRESLLADLQV